MKKFLLILISIVIVIILAQRIQGDWQRYKLLTEEFSDLESKKENLLKEQARLEQLLEQGSQKELLEKEARSMLGFKKEGEEVVLIIPSTNNTESATDSVSSTLSSSSSAQNSLLSNLSEIWYNFLEKLRIKR
ncbi:MAG: septum formation initiator family protein [Candidatus Pacebacteria bacterium]|nr:septum formation initiator family protein [Candidatus Paceibacterota bacterium]